MELTLLKPLAIDNQFDNFGFIFADLIEDGERGKSSRMLICH